LPLQHIIPEASRERDTHRGHISEEGEERKRAEMRKLSRSERKTVKEYNIINGSRQV